MNNIVRISSAAALLLLAVSSGYAEQKEESTIASLYHSAAEKRTPDGIELMKGVTMGILLEAEASYEKQGSDSASDIVLATFEAAIEAELKKGVSGHVLLLWEEDDTEPLDVDEGYIVLGNTDKVPCYLKGGKMYVPFGVFHSHFVSDPLVLELAETRESALMIGYANDFVDVSAGIFNGDLDDSSDDHADDIVASLTLTPAKDIELGAYYISDIGESEALQDTVSAAMEAADPAAPLAYDAVAAYGLFAHVGLGAIAVDVEYVAAIDDFNAGLLMEGKASPEALNIEVAYGVSESIEVAAKYESTDDFPEMPESQYGVCGSMGITDSMTFALEYLRGEFDDGSDDRDLVTAQVAVEF